MKSEEYFLQKNQNITEDNYKNIKNVLIMTFMVILAYLMEKFFKNVLIKSFCFLFILAIIVGVIMNSVSHPYIYRIKYFFIKGYDYKSYKENNEIKKERLEKVKNIYESGYLFNKMNNNSRMHQMLNRKESQFNYSNINHIRNEDDLDNKISNINKINNGPLMNTFNKKYTNDNSNEKYNENFGNNNINNNPYLNYNNSNKLIMGQKIYTNLPSNESSFNNFNQNKIMECSPKKDIVSSPFSNKSKISSSKISSSGDFFLFSNNNINKQLKNNLKNDYNLNNINPLNRLSYIQSISDFEKNKYENQKIIPKNKEVSYNKYQYLKNKFYNTQALNQDNNMLKYDLRKIPRELATINYNNWIIKMKNYISKNLIPNIITKHDENIYNLNTILSHLGLKITSSLIENEGDDYLNVLKERIYFLNSNKIDKNFESHENRLNNILLKNTKNIIDNNYQSINRDINSDNFNNISLFPSFMNFSNYLNDTKEKDNNKFILEKQLKNIFFGDTIKIKQILGIIENKINLLEMQKNNENKSTSNYQRRKIIKTININNNPFLRPEFTKTIDNYIRNINDSNNLTLINLQILLYERIIINERLFPKELFFKKDETHALLVMEYAIERFRQLQQDFNSYGNGSRGGEFLNESWCSLLPTDSQLISHLIINYIETIYEINNNRNQQIFLLSYPSNYNVLANDKITDPKAQTSVVLYQINPPNIEPKFNVVYDGNLIPCPLNDINLFHAFSIYFYLLSSKSAMFVMNLGIHGFINELIK